MGDSSITDLENQASAGDLSAQLRMARTLIDAGQVGPGRNWLRRAAEMGPTEIKLALGEHLLANAPYEIAEGVRWTRAAAEDGSPEAAHRLAVFAAEGVGEPQSWSSALLLLRNAATLGYRVAQAQLAGLAGDWARAKALLTGAATPAEAGRADDVIDLASWLKVPAARPDLPSPRIFTVARFLPSGMCDWLIERARPNLQRAQTFNPRTGGAQVVEGRNHSCIGFNVARSDVVIAVVRARMALLTGQRGLTFLAYLNEGYEGGETNFPRLGRSYKGNKGDAIFYDNVTPDGAPDRRTLHTGTILKRGEKWLMSQWIRLPPAWLRGQ